MIRKILVPVDGSAFAESALPWALRLAKAAGAELRLAMVSEPANLPPGIWADSFMVNHARYLDSTVGSLRGSVGPDAVISSTLLEGADVATALCDEAVAAGADLVVMSTHGHGGLTRLWLGSVADALLRESAVPVVLVRPEEGTEGRVETREGVAGVVVPLDGTFFAEAAIAPALEIADLFSAPVTLVRTVTYPVMVSSYLPDTAEANEAYLHHAQKEARAYLEAVRAGYDDGSVRMDTDVVVSQQPARGVLDLVAQRGTDLVVMSSHRRRGLKRAVLGSVADKVIRGSRTPVLVVRPRRQEQEARSEEVA